MTSRRQTLGRGTQDRAQGSLEGSGTGFGVGEPLQGAKVVPERSWRLWFPARLGPARKRKVRAPQGGKVVERFRVPELPPTKNGSRGNPYVHNAWVQEWREAARDQAWALRIPSCERIRISAVVHRSRLGVADAENDHARLAPLQDGLVDARVVPKDTYRYVERGSVREMRAGMDGPGIELIVEEI